MFMFTYILATSCGLWDLSSPTTDQTHDPAVGTRSLNHWTPQGSPGVSIFRWHRNQMLKFKGKKDEKVNIAEV